MPEDQKQKRFTAIVPNHETSEAFMEQLLLKLSRSMKSGTPAERKIAQHLIEHLADLPFETPATLAKRLKLSAMTVGRFLRSLGYTQFSDIRGDLRDAPPLTERSTRTPEPENPLSELLLQQIQAIQAVYDQTDMAEWQEALAALSDSRYVFVASAEGFGLCHYFYAKLTELRPGISYVHRDGSSYLALFDLPAKDTLLVMLDCGGGAGPLLRLTEAARKRGCRTLLITTRFYEWGPESADICLDIPLARSGEQDVLQMASTVDFLLHSLALNSPPRLKRRGRRIASLKQAMAL